MAYLHRNVNPSKVCDYRQSEGSDAAVMGNDDLGHCAHADGVAAKNAIHTIFCRSLKGRSLNAYVNAVLQFDAFFFGYLVGQSDESLVVRFVHIGKSRAGGKVFAT